jgi:hypothetical protein
LAHVAAGDARLRVGDRDGALACYRQAEQAAPFLPEAMDRLMRLSAERNLLDALFYAECLWMTAPNVAAFRDNLWGLASKAGQARDRDACRERAARRPTPGAFIALGNACRDDALGWEAECAYRRAAALYPDQPFAYSRLGCLHVQHHRYAAADRMFARAARWPGRDAVIRFSPDFFAACRAEWAPPPSPEVFGREGTNATIVFSACDGRYFDRFAAALLGSVAANAKLDCCFHLHVVNPPADIGARLADASRRLGMDIAYSTETVDAAALGDEAKTLYACARFRQLPALLRRWRRPTLMLDVDLLALKPLPALLAAAAEGDVMLVGGDHNRFEPWNHYWADVVAISPTERAVAFFDRVAAYIEWHLKRGLTRWFLDQIALTAAAAAGFSNEPPPRLLLAPRDVHRMSVERDGDDATAPPDRCLFWSAHASTVPTALTVDTPRYQQYASLPPDSAPSSAS